MNYPITICYEQLSHPYRLLSTDDIHIITEDNPS